MPIPVISINKFLLNKHSIRFHSVNFFNVMAAIAMKKRPSSDYAAFKAALKNAQNVAVITGAGISAESGIPTFRGAGGFWRRYQSQDLASPAAFKRNPSLVWEFYHYRRELVLTKKPNPAHYALATLESKLNEQNRSLMVITQNVDELHKAAGTKNLSELHGSLFKTRCTKCSEIKENRTSPICSGLAGKGAPDPDEKDERIDESLLPRCLSCNGLLRPHIVWFGETLDPQVLMSAEDYLKKCDLCLVVGTSALVYPAAMFAPQVVARGVNVAEFNIEDTPATFGFHFHFRGPSSETLPKAVDIF